MTILVGALIEAGTAQGDLQVVCIHSLNELI